MMQKFRGWGTILTGVAGLLTAVGSYLSGALPLQEAITAGFAAVALIFAARKGNDIKDAIKDLKK